MAHTYCANEFNSTPFSSCCGTASQDRNGRPDDHCHKCGGPLTHHEDSPAVRAAKRLRAAGKCGMCGKPIRDCYC